MLEKQKSQSKINEALAMAAVDSCAPLRKWSDSDGKLTPNRIGQFQEALTQAFAEIYFGTHERLENID
tara:strand:+ start:353 stop:556 length:204 start_codon:yes stop_codon:yes gene_type:complete